MKWFQLPSQCMVLLGQTLRSHLPPSHLHHHRHLCTCHHKADENRLLRGLKANGGPASTSSTAGFLKAAQWAVISERESCSVVSDSLRPHGLNNPWNSPGQNTGVGSHSLLRGILPTQGSNPGLPHCRRILYHLSHKGSDNAAVKAGGPETRPPALLK